MTEILEDATGSPYLFVAERREPQQAIDAIPAETLLRANRAQWTARGLEPPEDDGRRAAQKLLAKHEPAASRPDDLVLPIEEAARHLGLTGRVLRYCLQQGDYAENTRELPGGQTGLIFAPPARRWSLVVEGAVPTSTLVSPLRRANTRR